MNEKLVIKKLADAFGEMANLIEYGPANRKVRIGITIDGSELGKEEIINGAKLACSRSSSIEVILIGSAARTNLEKVDASNKEEAHSKMEKMLKNGEIETAVTMHYNFPLGVSTVGRIITPAKGKEMFIATTTGVSATEKTLSLLKNSLYGIAAAKACGNDNPSIGILNVEGARQTERILRKLKKRGYPIKFAESRRSGGGAIMRGNDLIAGSPDVMVTDTLSGNILMKMFSAYSTGGNYEALGYGYGPGLGEDTREIICILSRVSGTPVVAGAIQYAAEAVTGNILGKLKNEFIAAEKAGWDEIIYSILNKEIDEHEKFVVAPPVKILTDEIQGIDILEIETAVQVLWEKSIYAESGMGCTGPVVQVAEEDLARALETLRKNNFIV